MLLQSSNVEFSEKGQELIVKICGDIDHHSAKTLRARIDRELFSVRPKVLVLDLERVDFMDSSGLGLILGRAAKGGSIGCGVRVDRASERVTRLLLLAGADRMIEIRKKGEGK